MPLRRVKSILSLLFPCAAMLVLILDSKIALQGAQMGLELCIQTVIPSLFPFFVISVLLTGTLSGRQIAIFKPICRFCKMPFGAENLLLVGLLGGYPVGAKCIYEAWKQGQITAADAKRYLGFCNNAGPAFIFGMCGSLFSKSWIGWILWGIHVLSALLVGRVLPENRSVPMGTSIPDQTTLVQAMGKAITAILSVCGWVVLFRVILAFCQRWFMWLLPAHWRSVLDGILELTNGCNGLTAVESEGVRFVLCAAFLGFGGLCVALQTASVVGELGMGMYFPGKVMQCAFSCCLAGLFASLVYRICSPVLPGICSVFLLFLTVTKKTVAFPKGLVYNVEKKRKGEFTCYSGRKLRSPAATVPVAQR